MTEFVLIYDGRAYALAFDLTTDDPWEVVATRECETEQRNSSEVMRSETARELWELLQGWRQKHNIDYLAKNGLIPTTRL